MISHFCVGSERAEGSTRMERVSPASRLGGAARGARRSRHHSESRLGRRRQWLFELLGLPAHIHQEGDGSHEKFERVFQAIDTHDDKWISPGEWERFFVKHAARAHAAPPGAGGDGTDAAAADAPAVALGDGTAAADETDAADTDATATAADETDAADATAADADAMAAAANATATADDATAAADDATAADADATASGAPPPDTEEARAFASERRRADHAREDADLRRRANDSFHELDKNDDGHVSRSELIRALRLPKNAYLCEVGV